MFNPFGITEVNIAYTILLAMVMGTVTGSILGLLMYALELWRASLRNRRVRGGTKKIMP